MEIQSKGNLKKVNNTNKMNNFKKSEYQENKK